MTRTPSDALGEATRLLREGAPVDAVRELRRVVDELPAADTARVIGQAAAALGLTALAERASAVVAAPDSAEALYGFGYECIEEGGLAFAAVPALTAALRLRPDRTDVLFELVADDRIDQSPHFISEQQLHRSRSIEPLALYRMV